MQEKSESLCENSEKRVLLEKAEEEDNGNDKTEDDETVEDYFRWISMVMMALVVEVRNLN